MVPPSLVTAVEPASVQTTNLRQTLVEWHTEEAEDGILIVSAADKIVVANRACREIWHLEDASLWLGRDRAAFSRHAQTLLTRPSAFLAVMARIRQEPGATTDEQLELCEGSYVRWRDRPLLDVQGQTHGRISSFSDVTRLVHAEREALANEARTRAVIEGACDGIVSLDDDLHVLDFNPSAGQLFGWTREVLWQDFDAVGLEPICRLPFVDWIRTQAEIRQDRVRAEFLLRRQDGKVFPAECAIAYRGADLWVPFTLFVRDVSVQRHLEAELRQAQKLESVGRLASGIAHEINTPLQFVGDSLHFIREAVADLIEALDKCRTLRPLVTGMDEAVAVLDRIEEKADLAYLAEHAPRALERATDGFSRVASLVQGMKEFAHSGSVDKAPADLNRAVETTLTIARNEYNSVADVEVAYGRLPPVMCVVGEINQVLLAILVNAAHAIDDVNQRRGRGQITIRTWCDQASAFVSIQDTGGGIPEAVRANVFEPFFTTKAVGRGAGQGLAIARSVVVEKHGGDLSFETVVDQGTTFIIRLPLGTSPAA